MTRPGGRLRHLSSLACALLAIVPPAAAGEAETYGAGVEIEAATRIADILAEPDAFIGKTVRVEGGVIDVCPRKGCWMEIGEEGTSIRIKVEDDVIVFPAAARGRVAAAQGVVEAVEMTREDYLAWLAHLAMEKGEPFDAATAELGEGPYRLIRIRGTGATIQLSAPERGSTGAGAEESEMESACRREVIELHEWIEAWSKGELPDTDEAYARFTDALAADFVLISPVGILNERDAVVVGVRGAHGRWTEPPGQIRIEEIRFHAASGDLALVTYQEWHDIGEQSRGRLSSALFRRSEGSPNGVEWVHLSEVWLPRSQGG